MILRLGYGLPVPQTPRRPVCEVLDLPPENLTPGGAATGTSFCYGGDR